MVGFLRIDVVTTRGLNPDDDVTEMQDGQREISAIDLACSIKWVSFGLAPTFFNPAAGVGWQLPIIDLIVGHRKTLTALLESAIRQPIRRPRHDPFHQIGAVVRQVSCGVTRCVERVQNVDRSRWRIQPNTVCKPPVLVGIVRQHQRNFAICVGCSRQLRPVRRQIRNKCDAPAVCAIAGDQTLRRLVEIRLALEADRTRQDTAVNLGQRNIHGDITGREPA